MNIYHVLGLVHGIEDRTQNKTDMDVISAHKELTFW